MDLRGKAVLVTGGASGLGAAAVAALADAGAHPISLDLQPSGGLSVQGSVLSEPDVLSAIALAGTLGGLRAVVHCAGLGAAQRTVGKEGPLPLRDFERVIQVNLIGAFNVVRLAAAAMMENEAEADGERGVIVLTASIAAYDGQIGQAAYAASKAGIAGLTLPLAREFARSGIRVVSIAPGLFDTPLLAALPPAVKEELGRTVPFPNRLGRPSEYARLALSILENPMLNGEVIRLDGALRMPPR
ncbi:MAG TPA: SDR family NAD(P)-dependent oxidoreductase [Bryobacteraceae bacterium]|nr:SDR family NAD(P)-dependent oxidoreductase [Bryobacteraceae bacterium]